jgi:hypothetical protein
MPSPSATANKINQFTDKKKGTKHHQNVKIKNKPKSDSYFFFTTRFGCCNRNSRFETTSVIYFFKVGWLAFLILA